MEFSGCGTALVTPFRANGLLDEPALVRLVHRQIEAGISLLVACGTTGEAATLTDTETQRVAETVAAAAAGRVPVFVGSTHNSTREAVARARRLASIPGITGLLTANPYYSRPGQEGQFQHFRAIAESVQLPIFLYNIPPRTGANLEPATVLRLAEIPNIAGIKESSGNLIQITDLLTQLPRSFRVFAGDDALALPTLALGAAGLISVASNVIPAQMSDMIRAALEDDWRAARKINRQFFRLMQAHFWEPSPAPVKAVLALLGHGEDRLRLPMVPVTPATRRRLELLIGELGLLRDEPGTPLRMF
ncbi:MAG: 4-hydroxy-tetrahydrodipicolinate synthase [Acidobacteriota bacterium]|nr:4-hydroxy-tetrahydrodipicolinate synthase [Acidobacteriota bacterium]